MSADDLKSGMLVIEEDIFNYRSGHHEPDHIKVKKEHSFPWQKSPTYWVFTWQSDDVRSSLISAAENNGGNKVFPPWWVLQHQQRLIEPFTRVQFVCRAASSIWRGNRTSASQLYASAFISERDQYDDFLESPRSQPWCLHPKASHTRMI